MVQLVLRDLPEQKAMTDLQDHKGLREIPALKETQVQPDLLEQIQQ